MPRRFSWTGAGVVFACTIASITQAQTYTVTALPLPSGAAGCVARAISASGQIAGHQLDSAGNYMPVTWIGGTASVLRLPEGYPGANATGISDSGVVCGTAWTNGSFGFSAAVVWQNGTPAFIPTLGGVRSAADGISPSGVITGWTSMYGEYSGQRAYRFPNSTTISAGVIQGGGGSWTNGSAINQSGQIVGMGMTTSRFARAFLDDPIEGIMDLGTLGGVTSQALAISSAGHIAGWSQTGIRNVAVDDGIVEHAFLWVKGKMTDLGVLPGMVESQAYGVNASGAVVGRSTGATPGTTHRAFVWINGVLKDLNSEIAAGSGWTLQQAYAINDSGQIVGSGQFAGQTRAFLLNPIR